MELPRSPTDLEGAVLLRVFRGMGHQHNRHFPPLWSAPVCDLFPHATHTGDDPAALSGRSPVPYGKGPSQAVCSFDERASHAILLEMGKERVSPLFDAHISGVQVGCSSAGMLAIQAKYEARACSQVGWS